jgi:DNA-directed RNA polymerase sigma subunit (sigma70/sigma32)
MSVITRDDVENALSKNNKLSEQCEKVLCMRYGLAPYTETHTLEQISIEMVRARERIRQLELLALTQLGLRP